MLELKAHVKANPRDYPIVAEPDEFTWDDLSAAVSEEFVEGVEIVDFEVVA